MCAPCTNWVVRQVAASRSDAEALPGRLGKGPLLERYDRAIPATAAAAGADRRLKASCSPLLAGPWCCWPWRRRAWWGASLAAGRRAAAELPAAAARMYWQNNRMAAVSALRVSRCRA